MSVPWLEAAKRRFWASVKKGSARSCWPWTAGLFPNGYGNFGFFDRSTGQGGHVQAHRVAVTLARGPIPEGLTVDHLCKNKVCVNPAHLEVVTAAENALRGDGPPARNARKTHCIRGHPLITGNIYGAKQGRRRCRRCQLDHAKKRK